MKKTETTQEYQEQEIMSNIYENTSYRQPRYSTTKLNVNESTEGESIETKIERIVSNNEPIKDGAPIIHTERGKGVEPEYNIRTDRFEIAINAMDKVSKTYQARRDEAGKVIDLNKGEKDGGAESTEGK